MIEAIKSFLSQKIYDIQLVDYSWLSLLAYLLTFIAAVRKIWQFKKTPFTIFKLRKYLQWKCENVKSTLGLLSVLNDLDIKIIKYLSENPCKTLLDFADENRYFVTNSGSDIAGISSVATLSYSTAAAHIDPVFNEVQKAISQPETIALLSSKGIHIPVFDIDLMRHHIDYCERIYVGQSEQLQKFTKIMILEHNIEIKNSFKKLKEHGLLSETDIAYAPITGKFRNIFKYKE